LRLAFISYEIPPDTGGGGIGTYLIHVTRGLVAKGHPVALICGGNQNSRIQEGNLLIRKVAGDQRQFSSRAAQAFREEHQKAPFELVEVTDYGAWGLEVQNRFPDIPTVVKLHTPSFVIDHLHWQPPSPSQKIRMVLGALRRRQTLPCFRFRKGEIHKIEIETLKKASGVAATTRAVLARVAEEVQEITKKAEVYPYPFQPSSGLLDHPIPGTFGRVTFVGRLERRKGVLDLAAAIPEVRRHFPALQFRFIGRDMPSGRENSSCAEEIMKNYKRDSQLEILAPQPSEKVHQLYGETDICCFPSHWESFGIVVLEAMAAGRAVIVTRGSGMAEIVEHEKTGILVEPKKPKELAQAICRLAQNPELRADLGRAARAKVLQTYSSEVVLQKQVEHYKKVIEEFPKQR
jgi:glycogen(starch) synthase